MRSACVFLLAMLVLAMSDGAWAKASAARCKTNDLVVWLDTTGNGAAGSVYYKLEFTNLSQRTCTLFGYPGVSAMDLAGHQLGRAAARDAVHKPKHISIEARATASSVIRIVDADNFPRSSCRQTMAAGLRVFPPGQRASRTIPFPFRACSRAGPVYLSVQAVRR